MGIVEAVSDSLKNASTLDYVLLGVMGVFLVRYLVRKFRPETPPPPVPPPLPPLKKQDMTLEQLAQYDGTQTDGRILLAVDGKIFDVTRAQRLYGKEGPYGLFAGRDASRGLATFTINNEAVRNVHDDLSDLSAYEKDSMKEWSQQFSEKYELVGKLLKPGEEPEIYDEDSDGESNSSSQRQKDD